MITTIGIVFFLFMAVLGLPLFAVMAGISIVCFYGSGVDFSAITVEMYRMAGSPTLVTIPLFTFAGYLLAESKSPKRLFDLTHACLSWVPGGVAIISLVLCAFFTAFTGASGVTIIALGGLIYPLLLQEKYSEDFSLGLMTTSGSLGLLFAPSLPLILYGIIAQVDIDLLFKAGIIPGMFIILVLSIWSIIKRPKNTQKIEHSLSIKDAILQARYEIPIPFFVLGGIYSGVLTVTDAAVATAVYVFIIEVFLYKDLSLSSDIPKIIKESMSLVGAILIILCCALGLTSYLVDEEIPMKILAFTKTFIHSKYSFLLFLNLFLLVVGCLMDIFSAIIVVVPLIIPVSMEYHIHPVHLAMIFLVNLEIGYLTPPVGINLFISSFRFNKPMTTVYRATLPYLLLLIFTLLVITYVPVMSLLFVK